MSIGPVEYIVVAFPGNQFTGDIVPALAELVDSGTIRIIDLAFVIKDGDGNVAAMELTDLDSALTEAFSAIGGTSGGLFNEEDLEAAGEELPPNSSAALLMWENVWASTFVDAVAKANGELYDYGRVPREVVDAAIEYAESN